MQLNLAPQHFFVSSVLPTMAVCPSTRLCVKNTFLDGEAELLRSDELEDALRRSKSCIASLSEVSPWSVSKDMEEALDGSTDTDGEADCTDVDNDENEDWGDIDNHEHGFLWKHLFLPSSSHTMTATLTTPVNEVFSFNEWPDLAIQNTQLGVSGTSSLHEQSIWMTCENENFTLQPLPSAGSQYHGTMTEDGQPACKPCAWMHKAAGCSKGILCSYCHLCTKDELKNRKKEKVARMRSQDLARKQVC
jgi:hypothetical protein